MDQAVPSPATAVPAGPAIGAALRGRQRIRVLFLRPPRHFWPIINESDNFLLPLGYPCLAAYLRERLPGAEVEILDCCALQVGWKSLEAELGSRRPDVVCVGELTMYHKEGFRAFALAKKVLPDCLTVAGGYLYSALPGWSLSQCPALDVVVRHEGEETLRHLLATLRDGGDPATVPGIDCRGPAGHVQTPPRPLIEDLDSLPIPAYDIASVERYSPFGKLWPRAATIQRSRGCHYECHFCSWWVQEGQHRLEDGKLVPYRHYRTKSAARVIEETALLYEKFGVRYLFWVDGTWNLDSAWLDEYCSEIIRRDYKLGWWAFTRADLLLKQEQDGVLEKMVRAGLRHVLVGIERNTDDDFKTIEKTGYTRDVVKEAFLLLARKYPQVFRQGTILTGLRRDTAESIRSLLHYAHEINVDFPAFHPLMPFPGTRLWEEAKEKGWIEEWDYENYDMFYPVMPTVALTRQEISHHTQWCYQNFVARKPFRYLARLFSRHPIRRRLHWWFLFAIGRTLLVDLWKAIKGEKRFEGFAATNKMWKPGWYDR